jgi:hypothetical protein
MHVVSFPFGILGVSAESTSAAWTEPVPVDQSSLCNIDHFPNFRTQADLAGAFGSGAGLRLGTNLQVLPLSRAAETRARPGFRLHSWGFSVSAGAGEPLGRFASAERLDRHPVTVEFMIFVVSALTSAKVRKVMNELDCCDPLHHLEAELILTAQP